MADVGNRLLTGTELLRSPTEFVAFLFHHQIDVAVFVMLHVLQYGRQFISVLHKHNQHPHPHFLPTFFFDSTFLTFGAMSSSMASCSRASSKIPMSAKHFPRGTVNLSCCDVADDAERTGRVAALDSAVFKKTVVLPL